MRKPKFYFLALLALTAAGSGCSLNKMVKLAKEQQLTVTPSPLELHGDTVRYEISAVLPVKLLKKNKFYVLKNQYVAPSQTVELGDIEFKSTEFPNAKKEQPKLAKSFSFAYNDNLKKGDLKLQGTAYNASKSKSKTTDWLPVAKGIVTTSRSVKNVYYISYADHGYNNKEELEPTNVGFTFKKASSKLEKTELKGAQGKALEAFIAKKNVTRTVTITGTHSPEGAERVNTALSNDRAKTVEKYYRETMKKYKYNKGTADSISFVLKAVVDDWSAFKTALAADASGKLTEADKNEILDVVNNYPGDFNQKELQLQKLKSYKYVVKSIYPALRNATTEVLTVKPKKTDAQISVLATGVANGSVKADTLTDAELMYAATLTPDWTEKEKIYTAATKKNDTWQSHNNLAAVYLEQAKKQADPKEAAKFVDNALAQLNLAKQKQETANVYANLATVYELKNQREDVYAAVEKATSLSTDEDIKKGVNGIKAVIEVKTAKYDAAVADFNNAKLDDADVIYNLGLTYLLKKDYDKAKVKFDEATTANPNLAVAYYGGALVGARQQNADLVAARLQKAIQLDDTLRAKALDDLEFLQYWENPAFKAAVK